MPCKFNWLNASEVFSMDTPWSFPNASRIGLDGRAGPLVRRSNSRLLCRKWHSRKNPCSSVWLRIDPKCTINLVDSFSHADQPQTSAVLRVHCIKPHTLITDLKFKVLKLSLQSYFKVLLTTVLHCIVQSFLHNAEERKRHLAWQRVRYIFVHKLHRHIALLRNFPTEAPDGCDQTEIVENGGMQLVRQRLNVTCKIGALLPDLLQLISNRQVALWARRPLHRFLNLERDHSKPLTNIVVQLPGKPPSLPLLCLDQLPTHLLQRLLGQLLIGDVTRRTDVAAKGTIGVESRYAIIENPAIFSIMSAEAILHLKKLAPIERLLISLQATLEVLSVDPFRPAISKLLVNGASGEHQPGLIEISTQLVGAGHPDHHRNRGGDQSEAFLTFVKLFFRPFAFGNISHHAHHT